MAGEVEVGRGEFGAAIDDHDDDIGLVEGQAGLAIDFRRDQGLVVRDNAPGVHNAGDAAIPADFAIDAVAGNAGLVAYDRAAALRELVEEGGFADVGASADGDQWSTVESAWFVDWSAAGC